MKTRKNFFIKNLICLLVSIILLSGCSFDLSFIQIDEKMINKAVHFTDFKVEGNGGTLNVLYNIDHTSDYSNESLNFELL